MGVVAGRVREDLKSGDGSVAHGALWLLDEDPGWGVGGIAFHVSLIRKNSTRSRHEGVLS
jgi:hypothetical protein